MNIDNYLEELRQKGHSEEKCNLHCCAEWDFLPICKCSLEYGCCSCFESSEQVGGDK